MELKQVIDQISRERNIKKQIVAEAVKSALVKVASKRYPYAKIEAEYDETTGDIKLFNFKKVVESEPEMLDEETEINLPEARTLDPDCNVDDELGIPLEENLGRIDANIAKQVMMDCIQRAENEKAYQDYLPFKGKVVSGTVQTMDFKGAVVNLGKIDARIAKNELVRSETLRRGQQIDCLLEDLTYDEVKGKTTLILSRSSPDLVVALFMEEVPELEDGTVRVRDCVREAGNKTKICVDTQDRINPVATLIGSQGYKIEKVRHRLGGERIDVVEYTENKVNYLQALLSGVRIKNVEQTETEISCEVEKEDLAKAIGKSGVNIRLAEQAMGCKIVVREKGWAEATVTSIKDGVAQADAGEFSAKENVDSLTERKSNG